MTDTIALPPLPDRITETGARRIFLTEQEAMDYAREAVRLYIAVRVGAVPAGWLITIEGDNALVRAPIDGPGGTTVAKYHGNLQGRVLFALAHALAAAPTTPPDAQGDER